MIIINFVCVDKIMVIIYFSGDETQLKKVATVFLQGLLKLIRAEEHAEHHPKAYMCLGLYIFISRIIV